MYSLESEWYASYSGSQYLISGNVQNEMFQNYDYFDDSVTVNDPNSNIYQVPYLSGDVSKIVPDFSDACLKFINDILMEEELDDKPATLEDYLALQATEKSLYDALGETYQPSAEQLSSSAGQSLENSDDLRRIYGSEYNNSTHNAANGNIVEGNWLIKGRQLNSFRQLDDHCQPSESTSQTSSGGFGLADSPVSTLFVNKSCDVGDNDLLQEAYKFIPKYNESEKPEVNSRSQSSKGKNHNVVKVGELGEEFVDAPRDRKNHQRENTGHLEERSTKQIAPSNEDYVEMKKFDDILICEEGKDDISPYTRKNARTEAEENLQQNEKSKETKSRRKSMGGKKKSNKGKVVDIQSLLIQCAQAVASFELTTANELLKQVREHASQFGDSAQRVAYYFANGLEARLAGTGSDQYKYFAGKPISSSEILKGYKLYVSAVPFQRTSYFISNQTIAKLAAKATKIHIIDFGIFFGFQWPGLIQLLSRRRHGPPRLRITGVDYPTSGFRPAQKIEETGKRLAGYCERFGVPFEFQAIAQMWHTIKPEHFKIEKDELVVVSCLYQSKKLPDDSFAVDSPRDCYLRMIRSLNPDLFIHGVVNGTFNAPFFLTRFREALYHYSALFDVFEATMPREDQERLSIETLLYGKDAMNIVACEGSERIERPESYKQWHVRHLRAGFQQVQLDQGVMNRAGAMVKANYHKDFMLEQYKCWMVQGWKGRILSAVSVWKPA